MNPRDCIVVPEADLFSLKLGVQPQRTPAGEAFLLPTSALAEGIALEWRAQGEKLNPLSMPLTQLAVTAIDLISPNTTSKAEELSRYGSTDLLCHHAAEPTALASLQEKMWGPALAWCLKRFDAALMTTTGVMPVKQPVQALESMERYLKRLSSFDLAGLQQAVHATGSLVLGVALVEGHYSSEEIFDLAELDTTFQIEKWGSDPALDNKRADTLKQLQLAETWFRLLQTSR